MSDEGAIILSVIVLGLNLAWLIPFIVYMRRRGRQLDANIALRRRLLETGRDAKAVVTKVTETSPAFNKVPHLDFILRVQPGGGAPFEAKARGFFRQIDFGRLHEGCEVEVKFDPNDRSTVAVVGDELRRG